MVQNHFKTIWFLFLSIPTNDQFFSQLSPPQTCMEFGRSTPYCFEDTRNDIWSVLFLIRFLVKNKIWISAKVTYWKYNVFDQMLKWSGSNLMLLLLTWMDPRFMEVMLLLLLNLGMFLTRNIFFSLKVNLIILFFHSTNTILSFK